MKNKTVLLAGAVLALMAVAGGFYYLQGASVSPQMSAEEIARQEAARHAASIEGRFETVLNAFLADIDGRLRDYKSKRKILTDMVKPENMRNPGYIAENYILSQTLIPEMHGDMNTLLMQFEKTEAKIEALSQDKEIVNRDVILARWNEVKKSKGDLYMDFFSLEQEVLDRYARLFEVYNAGRVAYFVDVSNGVLTFTDEKLQSDAETIRLEIKSLEHSQKELLKSS